MVFFFFLKNKTNLLLTLIELGAEPENNHEAQSVKDYSVLSQYGQVHTVTENYLLEDNNQSIPTISSDPITTSSSAPELHQLPSESKEPAVLHNSNHYCIVS